MQPRFVILALCAALFTTGAWTEDASWKKPLAEKEKMIEANIQRNHSILGLYPSQVEIPLDGSPADNTTTGISNIAHSVCWTANYLAGCSFRHAFLVKSGAPEEAAAEARARADEVFEAVYRCQLVTGKPGLQARGYFPGHGESYEERWDDRTRNEWHQGTGEYADFRWRGDPSHHNYSDAVHGLFQYWRLAAEGAQKERAAQAIHSLVSYWVDADYMIHKLDDSRQPVPILGWMPVTGLNTRVLMAIAGAKYAHVATGDEKFAAAYEDLVARAKVRGMKAFAFDKDFDDAEHCFCHLECLLRIEDDPELLAAYRLALDTMWPHYTGDGQALFTYIYAGLNPGDDSLAQPLAGALRALQTWPTDMTLKPAMNSLHPQRKPPYPTYAAAWDNEYIWKGNLLRADGWVSRIVVDVAVPGEDPMVIYAIDEAGDIYQSRDGAETAAGWRPISKNLNPRALAIDAGPRVRMVYAACADGFYLSTTGGYTWERMPVPEDGGRPLDIMRDPARDHVLYAATTRGAYRCADHGEEFLGRAWESLSAGLPEVGDAHYHAAPGNPGRVYAVLKDITFSRALDSDTWQRGSRVGMKPYAESYPWFVTNPADPSRAYAAMRGNVPGIGMRSMLQITRDGGQEWSNNLQDLYEKFHTAGLAELMATLMGGDICKPAIDPDNPEVMYTGIQGGVLKSADGGETWEQIGLGLDIPWVRSVFVPRHGDWMFAGTPAGLYRSRDGGHHWESAHLVLQFEYNTRRELGGAAYIDAYWRGRYYGFIGDEQAMAPITE